jgi:hypothetical protein
MLIQKKYFIMKNQNLYRQLVSEDFREIGIDGAKWIRLAQDRV